MVLPNTLKEIKTTWQKLFVKIVYYAPYSEAGLNKSLDFLRMYEALDIKLLQPKREETMSIYTCIIISMVCVFQTHYSQISQRCNIDKQKLFTTFILILHELDYYLVTLTEFTSHRDIAIYRTDCRNIGISFTMLI